MVPTFAVIALLMLTATFLALFLSLGKALEWEPWAAIFAMLAVTAALFPTHPFSRDFGKAESISMFTLLIGTSVLLSAPLLLAKGLGKGSVVSTLTFLAAIVTFFSIWLFA